MKISELKNNWGKVRDNIITAHPFVGCSILYREIDVEDEFRLVTEVEE